MFVLKWVKFEGKGGFTGRPVKLEGDFHPVAVNVSQKSGGTSLKCTRKKRLKTKATLKSTENENGYGGRRHFRSSAHEFDGQSHLSVAA